MTQFRKLGWLSVDKREIQLLDPVRIKALAAGTETCPMA